MQRAITLVHKGAMPIAVPAIKSFAAHFSKSHSLTIHTDHSIEQEDIDIMKRAAEGIRTNIVTWEEREHKIKDKVKDYPFIRKLLRSRFHYIKLEIPMMEEIPYFFFDSDIIWMKHVNNLKPSNAPNAFSTESWSSYNGIVNPRHWIVNKTPRRVNSGFYYISEPFPYEKLENLLVKGYYIPGPVQAGDQEIFAYLYPDLEYFHPEDLKRSRIGGTYNLSELTCAALHFPGGMWRYHLDQIDSLVHKDSGEGSTIRYIPSQPFTLAEYYRMKATITLGESRLLAKPFNIMRKLLREYR